MLSFFTFAVLAIAVQSLFNGVDAAVLPKRQSVSLPILGGGISLESIIQSTTANLTRIVGVTGPLGIDVTFGLGDEGSDQIVALVQQIIPVALNNLTGPGNSVNLTSVPGQSPSSIGIGITTVNGTAPGVSDAASIFSQISALLSDILSSFFGVNNITIFPIPAPGAGGSLLGGVFPTIPGQNSTLPGLNGTTPPFSGTPNISPLGLPLPTFNPATLPSPIPSNIASSIEVQLSSIASGIHSVLSSILPLPTHTSVGPLPTEISALPLPTDISALTGISVGPLPTDILTSVPAVPTISLGIHL